MPTQVHGRLVIKLDGRLLTYLESPRRRVSGDRGAARRPDREARLPARHLCAPLLFLRRLPETGEPGVIFPFIHQVVGDRLYWAGARAWIESGRTAERLYRNPADPMLPFWGIPVEEALAELRTIIAAQGTP